MHYDVIEARHVEGYKLEPETLYHETKGEPLPSWVTPEKTAL